MTTTESQTRPHRTRMGGWFNRLTITVFIVAIILATSIYLPGAFTAPEAPKYQTHTISRGDLVVSVIEQGTIESSNNTEIKCRVRGFSTVTWVIEGGEIVKPGDTLVTLDTKVIEEQLSTTKTEVFEAQSTLERTRADLEEAEIALEAYPNGRFRAQKVGLEQQRQIAESNLKTSQKMLDQSKLLFRKGYINKLDIDANAFTVEQAQLELEVKEKEIEVLENYTYKMEMETLEGNLRAAAAKLKSDEAALKMEQSQQARAEQELVDCTVKAERGGLVIFPSAAAWRETPDITQGASVRKDQILLLMPDLTQMQVKVGIHESVIDKVKPGMPARVTLADKAMEAVVTSVSAVTRPAGWWTGNVVKYDTIIKLPAEEGLKPGMSAEVEVVMAHHKEVLKIPVGAVIETEYGDYCWVDTQQGPQQRVLKLGDTNDVFIEVRSGLEESERVILNPSRHIDEAKQVSRNTYDETPSQSATAGEDAKPKPDSN